VTKAVRIARSILAPILGYAAVAIGTTIDFRLTHGINLRSPPSHLVFGTMGILTAGLIGGAFAAWIGGRKPVAHAASVLIFLVADSTTVIFFRHRHDALWFGLMSALGLMAATVAGGFAYAALLSRCRRGPVKAARH
jgi:cellobiose-specific phosphotransferase system component IIC